MHGKIVDNKSKIVNWKRVEFLSLEALRGILIMNAVVISAGLLIKSVLWLAAV